MTHFILQAAKPLAEDSPDHLVPRGTKVDNSRNPFFNQKLYSLLPGHRLKILDLGCSGGGFVKSCIDDGHMAIGLEGSDYSKQLRRAAWGLIPKNLFTCDVTAPFQLSVHEDKAEAESPITFDVITAWELLEHLPTDRLAQFCANVDRHLKPRALWIVSISDVEDRMGQVVYHQTVQSQEWWTDRLRLYGFQNHPSLVKYFGKDWVRGPFQNAHSFHLVMSRLDEPPPPVPAQVSYPFAVRLRTAAYFTVKGIKTKNKGNLQYAMRALH
jgi:hypothetical protein